MMAETAMQTVVRVNSCLGQLLDGARRALRGESEFDAEDVRRLRQPVTEMTAIVAQSAELRSRDPEIGGPLDLYVSQLAELQTLLVRIRVMLHSRQASLQTCQAHHTAVSRWVTAFQQTR